MEKSRESGRHPDTLTTPCQVEKRGISIGVFFSLSCSIIYLVFTILHAYWPSFTLHKLSLNFRAPTRVSGCHSLSHSQTNLRILTPPTTEIPLSDTLWGHPAPLTLPSALHPALHPRTDLSQPNHVARASRLPPITRVLATPAGRAA